MQKKLGYLILDLPYNTVANKIISTFLHNFSQLIKFFVYLNLTFFFLTLEFVKSYF